MMTSIMFSPIDYFYTYSPIDYFYTYLFVCLLSLIYYIMNQLSQPLLLPFFPFLYSSSDPSLLCLPSEKKLPCTLAQVLAECIVTSHSKSRHIFSYYGLNEATHQEEKGSKQNSQRHPNFHCQEFQNNTTLHNHHIYIEDPGQTNTGSLIVLSVSPYELWLVDCVGHVLTYFLFLGFYNPSFPSSLGL